ncbi:(2Fe-2S)-binding protein [Streptomyces sp. NPDC060194]|uniref:(2Fe-2S)-binding protein n=1 Tax=Streptomyces sp. NPDC060194 TaxID=3347069 RepID=UPI00364D9590
MSGWDIAAVGGFFALRTDGPGGQGGTAGTVGSRGTAVPGGTAGSGGTDTVPLADLYRGRTAPLLRRVDTVAARLRTPERRVAASIAHLGLAARLWSIGLGAAALHGAVPDLSGLRWDPDAAAPDDLWLTAADRTALDLAAPTDDPAALAARLRAAVLDGHLTPLAAALRRDHRVSAALLRGNSASALAGAHRALRDWSRANHRPEAARRATAVAHALFALPELRGTGTLRAGAFRRTSCCLYYRVPAGGLCGDCCLDHPPVRSSVRATGE